MNSNPVLPLFQHFSSLISLTYLQRVQAITQVTKALDNNNHKLVPCTCTRTPTLNLNL